MYKLCPISVSRMSLCIDWYSRHLSFSRLSSSEYMWKRVNESVQLLSDEEVIVFLYDSLELNARVKVFE